jgi:hypothetical protein
MLQFLFGETGKVEFSMEEDVLDALRTIYASWCPFEAALALNQRYIEAREVN